MGFDVVPTNGQLSALAVRQSVLVEGALNQEHIYAYHSSDDRRHKIQGYCDGRTPIRRLNLLALDIALESRSCS